MKRIFVLVVIFIISISTNLYSHILQAGMIKSQIGQNVGMNARHFSFHFSLPSTQMGGDDPSWFAFFQLGLAYKSKDKTSSPYFKFIFLERTCRKELSDARPHKPRIESFHVTKALEFNRTGIYDVDHKWIGVGWGQEFYIAADTALCYNNHYNNYYISKHSFSFRYSPEAYIRTFKPGSFGFSDLGSAAHKMTTSIFVGLEVGLRVKLGEIELDSKVKAEQCMFYPIANLESGVSLSYKFSSKKKNWGKYLKLSLNFDYNQSYFEKKAGRVGQVSFGLSFPL